MEGEPPRYANRSLYCKTFPTVTYTVLAVKRFSLPRTVHCGSCTVKRSPPSRGVPSSCKTFPSRHVRPEKPLRQRSLRGWGVAPRLLPRKYSWMTSRGSGGLLWQGSSSLLPTVCSRASPIPVSPPSRSFSPPPPPPQSSEPFLSLSLSTLPAKLFVS